MKDTSGNRLFKRFSPNGQGRFMALGLAVLVLFALLFGGIHHHDDLQVHADCAVCLAGHHSPADSVVTSLVAGWLPVIIVLFVLPAPMTVIARHRTTIRGRAPPC